MRAYNECTVYVLVCVCRCMRVRICVFSVYRCLMNKEKRTLCRSVFVKGVVTNCDTNETRFVITSRPTTRIRHALVRRRYKYTLPFRILRTCNKELLEHHRR